MLKKRKVDKRLRLEINEILRCEKLIELLFELKPMSNY